MAEKKGCLFAILELLSGGGAAEEERLPYRAKDYLLTKAERSFYGVLEQAVGGSYLIFAKVRMSDLLKVEKGTENRQSHFNRIQAKHIDFVLCDPEMVRPVCAVELDDSSHKRARTRERDEFVDLAFRSAGLPLLRVPAKRTYSPEELRGELETATAPDSEPGA